MREGIGSYLTVLAATFEDAEMPPVEPHDLGSSELGDKRGLSIGALDHGMRAAVRPEQRVRQQRMRFQRFEADPRWWIDCRDRTDIAADALPAVCQRQDQSFKRDRNSRVVE